MKFQVVSDYKPTGDQPQAIDKLSKGILNGEKYQTLLGVTGSGKTFTIANVVQEVQKPTLVLASDDPGIFVTNIRNEYSHLYLMLKNKKLSEDEIFTKLEMLVRNAQIYRF